MRLSKEDAARLLRISIRTLEMRMKAGAIQFEKEPQVGAFKGSARVTVILPDRPSASDSDAQPAPCAEPAQRSEPVENKREIQPSNIELKADADRAFAQAYLRGEACDSAGNRADGSNDRYPTLGPQSLLGPAMRDNTPPRDSQQHMNPALLGHSGPTQRWSFDCGLSDDALKAMRADWNRRGGGPSMSQQREAVERSRTAIHAAFDYAKR